MDNPVFHHRGDAALAADMNIKLTDNPLKRRGVLSLKDEVADQCPIDDAASAAASVNAEATEPPLVMLGQGDYTLTYPAPAMTPEEITSELIGRKKRLTKESEKRCDALRRRNEAISCGTACLQCFNAITETNAYAVMPAAFRAEIHKAIDAVRAEYDELKHSLTEAAHGKPS